MNDIEHEKVLEEAQPANENDVSAIIGEGLRELGVLKTQVSEAESVVTRARVKAEEQLSVVKTQANEEVTKARSQAREELVKAKAKTDADIAQAKERATAIVTKATSEINREVDSATASMREVKKRYSDRINHLIQTGWATPGALSSLGHSLPRSGGRKPGKK